MTLRIAYLNTQYPSLSHTFIEREIRAVRARGIEVHTFSINNPRPQDRMGERHSAEAKNTYILKPSLLKLLLSVPAAKLRWPIGYVKALLASQKLFPPGVKNRLTALGYLFEAARLVLELDRRGLRHIHVHMANNGAAVAMLACMINPRLTYSLTIHGSAEFFDVHRLNLREKTQRATFVRCISNFCRAQVMAWSNPAAWDRFHVVHCAVDPEVLSPRSPSGRTPSAEPEGVPNLRRGDGLRLITVGRLDPIKGYPLLLEAIAKVVVTNPNVHLTMVGSGPLESLLKEKVASLKLANHVTLPGAISAETLPSVLDEHDCLVVSSFMEGVPVVLMEAMSKEMLVISTAVGGVPELVTHNENGLITPPGSVDALANAITDLANRRESLDAMRTAARDTILKEFNVHNQGEQMQALFEKYVRE